MTREELDILRKYAEVTDLDKPPLSDRSITALLDHITRLERERDELRKMFSERELKRAENRLLYNMPVMDERDTATKETGQ